ncbi:DUF4238 domain-containing protein [Streptomyces sp. CBMA123]|uniref:DUF4238 domain-containing protein n=1 Tax=Streptomyces sp. CBMA123 TaxID=1896313 RepID=UPI001CB864FF|nr:DUF4238 domain-containing protein [Streptomyces sp. CBMA123]
MRYLRPPTPAEYDRLVLKLLQEPRELRPDQHVVSRVLLERFAEAVGAKGERKVRYLNRSRPSAKPIDRGPAGCGKFTNFIRYASKASEQVWAETETLLHSAIDAAESGDFFRTSRHQDVVREAIILHTVRSIPMLIISEQTWREHHDRHITRWMTERREALVHLHRERFGWTPDESGLRVMAEDLIASLSAQMDRGIYFHATVVERFRRYKRMLAKQPVELRRLTDGELLISDVPVLALREGSLGTGPLENHGIENCDELVLPLSPRLLAVLGAGRGYSTMDAASVDRINAAQIRASADYVYMRPGSGLESFVRTSMPEVHPNRIPSDLRQTKVPTTFARTV